MCRKMKFSTQTKGSKTKVLERKIWSGALASPGTQCPKGKSHEPKVTKQELWCESSGMEVPKQKSTTISSETEVLIPKLRTKSSETKGPKTLSSNCTASGKTGTKWRLWDKNNESKATRRKFSKVTSSETKVASRRLSLTKYTMPNFWSEESGTKGLKQKHGKEVLTQKLRNESYELQEVAPGS